MTTNLEMPKFDVSSDSIREVEEMESKTKEMPYFKPGLHEVVIDNAVLEGAAKDPNWITVLLTYKGTRGQTIRDYVLVPVKSAKYQGKNGPTGFPFRKFKELMAAIGTEVTEKNLNSVLNSRIAKLDRLKGLNLAIEVGYNGAHLKGKRVDGDSLAVNIVLKDGTIVKGADGTELIFGDFAAAEAYAAEQSIDLKKFVNVTGYKLSSTPAKANGTNF